MATKFVSTRRLQVFWGEVKKKLDEKSNKSQYVESTLLASNWSSNIYSFEDIYPSSQYDIVVEPSQNCTLEQLEEYKYANLVGSSTSNKLKAYEDIPIKDIPIIIEVRRK